MKVLLFSGDPSALREGSDTRRRLKAYADVLGELNVVVLTPERGVSRARDGSLFLYPASSRFRAFRLLKALLFGFRLSKTDVLSAQDPFFIGLAALLCARRRPVEIQVHTDVFSPEFSDFSFGNRVRVRLARAVLSRASSIRVVSERIRRSLLSEGIAVPVSVLPVFVNWRKVGESPRAPIPGRYARTILMVSRLSPEKDWGTALRAFTALSRDLPGTGLVIVGDGKECSLIEREVRRLGLSKNVLLTGARDDVAGWYRSADAFLLTSRYEGYGRTLIEAAAARCPIVSTDVGVIGAELKRDHAIVCPVGDAVCLARGLIRVLQDPGAAASMAERAYRDLAKLPQFAEEHAEAFRAALARCFSERVVSE